MKKEIKVKVYYQDFKLNAMAFCNGLRYEPETATEIGGFEVQAVNEQMAADIIFEIFNQVDANFHARFPELQAKFKAAGHTSMSVGDYIVSESGKVLICNTFGWSEPKEANLVAEEDMVKQGDIS